MRNLFAGKSAPLIDRIPYWGFVTPDVVMTKHGQLLFFARVSTAGVDGRAPEQLDRVNQAWQKLLGNVEEPHRAFLIFNRPEQEVPGDFEDRDDIAGLAQRKRLAYVCSRVRRMQTYLCLAFDPQLAKSTSDVQRHWMLENVRRWLVDRQKTDHLTVFFRQQVEQAVATARNRYRAITSLVNDLTPLQAVEGDEVASLLYRLVNQGQGKWEPLSRPMPYGLCWRLTGPDLSFQRSHMLVGDAYVALYSLALPPQASAANALGELYSLPHDLSVVLEWRGVDRYDASSRLRATQKHYNTARWSSWSAIQQTEGTSAALENAAAGAAVEMLSSAQLELETHGVPYGDFALSISVAAASLSELDEVGAAIERTFIHLDGKAVHETYGQPSVWFQRWPGQPRRPFARPVFISSGQAASLAPLFGPSAGYSRCAHLDRPPLTWFETRSQSSYGYDLFGGKDVGHTLVLGATGSGKSFLLNFLLTQALQYDPRVVILDLGGSYKWITSFLNGSHLAMDVEGDKQPRLPPFSLPPGQRTFQFLVSWIERLLRLGHYDVIPEDKVDIRARLEDLYELPYEERTLGNLVMNLTPRLRPPLAQWVGSGPWAPTFDGAPEPFDLAKDKWQVIDLAGAQEHHEWCTAALFYLFERLRLIIDDEEEISTPKLMVVDEAWRYLADEAVLNSLTEAAKTWRKRNAALVMATQSVVDITGSDAAKALLEMLPTKLFLANPDFPVSAQHALNLTDEQYHTIRGLEPKQEMYLHRSAEQVVLRLAVDPESYWLYTSSPVDAGLRAKMVKRYGLEGALFRLAAGLREVEESTDESSRKAVFA